MIHFSDSSFSKREILSVERGDNADKKEDREATTTASSLYWANGWGNFVSCSRPPEGVPSNAEDAHGDVNTMNHPGNRERQKPKSAGE
jgi:hypothetical protein